MTDHVQTYTRETILEIQFNRPDKKNALSLAMYTALAEVIRRAEADPALRVLLFRGSEDCFTSGNDLGDFLNTPPHDESSPVLLFLNELIHAKKPIVAAVNGVAVGIGTTMLLHCDLVYAGTGARFQLPFVNLGLCPEAGSSLLFPQLVGHRRASELLLLGEMFDASRAREIGIVNEVHADHEVYEKAMQKAQRLAAQPPNALRTTKELLRRCYLEDIKRARAREDEKFLSLLRGPEAREAMSAFLERRRPDFSKF